VLTFELPKINTIPDLQAGPITLAYGDITPVKFDVGGFDDLGLQYYSALATPAMIDVSYIDRLVGRINLGTRQWAIIDRGAGALPRNVYLEGDAHGGVEEVEEELGD
jgi:hypothetical protein